MRFSPPDGIKICPADATKKELISGIRRERVTELEVSEETEVALERGEEVVPIPPMLMTL